MRLGWCKCHFGNRRADWSNQCRVADGNLFVWQAICRQGIAGKREMQWYLRPPRGRLPPAFRDGAWDFYTGSGAAQQKKSRHACIVESSLSQRLGCWSYVPRRSGGPDFTVGGGELAMLGIAESL